MSGPVPSPSMNGIIGSFGTLSPSGVIVIAVAIAVDFTEFGTTKDGWTKIGVYDGKKTAAGSRLKVKQVEDATRRIRLRKLNCSTMTIAFQTTRNGESRAISIKAADECELAQKRRRELLIWLLVAMRRHDALLL